MLIRISVQACKVVLHGCFEIFNSVMQKCHITGQYSANKILIPR